MPLPIVAGAVAVGGKLVGKIFKKKEGGTKAGNLLRGIFKKKNKGGNATPSELGEAVKDPLPGAGGGADAIKQYMPFIIGGGAFILLLTILKK